MNRPIKRICICGSMSFIDQIEKLGDALRANGFEVATPVREEQVIRWNEIEAKTAASLKRAYIDGHLEKIRQSDALLIANFPKNAIEGYVGANALMEAAFGYVLGMPVVLLFEPGPQPCRLEIRSIMNSCLNGEPDKLSWHLA